MRSLEQKAPAARTQRLTAGERTLRRVGPSKTDERRQAGTLATLEENIDHPIDEADGTGPRPQAQPYQVRWLMSRHLVSAPIAAVIAAELGMGGAP
jgi:hypothetical protein